ncbi:MAG: DUF5698 domain-containing protein [Lachnospiraceae bacterium]|nr:DUF5698 domain-containing protein [Lachnospiraceae bacterium]
MIVQILLYLLIFLAKLIEVALATVRNVLINRGEKLLGAAIGFVEVMIWIIVVSNVLGSLAEDPVKALVYCLAFACGNYFGVIIEGKLAIGTACIQVMIVDEPNTAVSVMDKLKKSISVTEDGKIKEVNCVDETNTYINLKTLLRNRGFGVTTVPAQGLDHEVNIMMIYLKRKSVPEALDLIRTHSPSALVTVNDIRQMRNGFIRK